MQDDNKQKVLSLVDPTTGEVTEGQILVNFPKRYLPKHFNIFTKDIKDLRKLTVYTYEVFLCLVTSMKRGNKIEMSEREIASLAQLSQSAVHKAIQHLKKRDIIRGTRSSYIINPKYALNGGASYFVAAYTNYYDTRKG